MSSLELRFLERLGDQWQDATPGFSLQAYHKGKKVADVEVGDTYRFYDLASLTKLIFTTSAYMLLLDQKRLQLDQPIARWIEAIPVKSTITARQLLSHSAGMTWWYPFFEELAVTARRVRSPEAAWDKFLEIFLPQVQHDIVAQKGRVYRGKSNYSDVDFFLLGLLLTQITSKNLFTNWQFVQERLALRDIDFHPMNRPVHARNQYAPTESCPWRRKTLRGEVHDDNAWTLKGVAPHAGLFGTIDAVSNWGLQLRRAVHGKATRHFASPATTRLFTRRAIPVRRGDWALGFMLPTKGEASCGKYFSSQSIGHTGFTGTSIWFDPRRDLLLTILSNRVYPSRENNQFKFLRPLLHDWIVEELL